MTVRVEDVRHRGSQIIFHPTTYDMTDRRSIVESCKGSMNCQKVRLTFLNQFISNKLQIPLKKIRYKSPKDNGKTTTKYFKHSQDNETSSGGTCKLIFKLAFITLIIDGLVKWSDNNRGFGREGDFGGQGGSLMVEQEYLFYSQARFLVIP